jgi:hypothetical protein
VFTLPQYAYMSLICNLPNDLFHSVLLWWLRHVDVGRLDSAMCNTEQRQQFQSSVTHSGFVLSNCYRSAAKTGVQNRLDSFVQWFMKRGIATSQLIVTDSFVIDGGERLKYLRQCGKRVSEVIICNIMAHFNEIKAAIEDVCVHCPKAISVASVTANVATLPTNQLIFRSSYRSTKLSLAPDHKLMLSSLSNSTATLAGKNCASNIPPGNICSSR